MVCICMYVFANKRNRKLGEWRNSVRNFLLSQWFSQYVVFVAGSINLQLAPQINIFLQYIAVFVICFLSYFVMASLRFTHNEYLIKYVFVIIFFVILIYFICNRLRGTEIKKHPFCIVSGALYSVDNMRLWLWHTARFPIRCLFIESVKNILSHTCFNIIKGIFCTKTCLNSWQAIQ